MTTSGGIPTNSSVWPSFSSLWRQARSIGEGLVCLFFPPRCALCGRWLDTLRILCASCEERLPSLEGPRCRRCGEILPDTTVDLCLACGTQQRAIERFFALGPYEGGWGILVRALKFEREIAVGRFLARQMADWVSIQGLTGQVDLVTYVPMTRHDRRERGFNQAGLLAAELAKHVRLPMCTTLMKARPTPPQRRLTADRRKDNLRDAFRLLRCGGERVLLVDDICTTGSTAEECARVLKRGGYKTVYVLTVARA